jgi:predicted transcriptional regulator
MPCPLSVIIPILLDFDVAPGDTRTALSRLVRKGALDRTKDG